MKILGWISFAVTMLGVVISIAGQQKPGVRLLGTRLGLAVSGYILFTLLGGRP